MHFQPSHLSQRARSNLSLKAPPRPPSLDPSINVKAPPPSPPGGPPGYPVRSTESRVRLEAERAQSAQRALALCTLSARAKARHQQRAAQGQPPVASTTAVTLLTAEEQMIWSGLGGKPVSDALLLTPDGECDRDLLKHGVQVSVPPTEGAVMAAPAAGEDAPAQERGAGTYILAAAGAALAAFFALR